MNPRALIDTTADVPTDLVSFDVDGLKAYRSALESEQLSLTGSVDKANSDRDAAYRAGASGPQLDQLGAVTARLQTRQTDLIAEQHRVDQELRARLAPLVQAAHDQARTQSDALRREAADLTDRLEGSVAAGLRDADALAALPGRMSQAQAQYLVALDGLGGEPAGDIRWGVRLDAGRLWEMALDVRDRLLKAIATLWKAAS
jgi:hypothetical protein